MQNTWELAVAEDDRCKDQYALQFWNAVLSETDIVYLRGLR